MKWSFSRDQHQPAAALTAIASATRPVENTSATMTTIASVAAIQTVRPARPVRTNAWSDSLAQARYRKSVRNSLTDVYPRPFFRHRFRLP